jgi:hypothetical protein
MHFSTKLFVVGFSAYRLLIGEAKILNGDRAYTGGQGKTDEHTDSCSQATITGRSAYGVKLEGYVVRPGNWIAVAIERPCGQVVDVQVHSEDAVCGRIRQVNKHGRSRRE